MYAVGPTVVFWRNLIVFPKSPLQPNYKIVNTFGPM